MSTARPSATRRYRSAGRAQQARETRRRVLEVAARLFADRGYGGTTMSAIAAEARVSVPTLELAFRTKAGLLRAAIDEAIAGDDEPIPMLERPWFAQMRGAGSVPAALERLTAVLAPAQQRSAGALLALFEAARTDPELVDLSEQMLRQRAVTAASVLDVLLGIAPLQPDLSRDDAVETLWVLMDPAVFDRLVRQRGWSLDRYQRWLAVAVRALLVPHPDPTHPPLPEEIA